MRAESYEFFTTRSTDMRPSARHAMAMTPVACPERNSPRREASYVHGREDGEEEEEEDGLCRVATASSHDGMA